MRRMVRNVLVLLLAMAFLAPAVYGANTLDKIKKEGKIVIGVKADYPPWGMRDKDGNVAGMEIDMANDVAKRLGVKLEMVVVLSSNRIDFLQQGKIDLILATMNDTEARRKVVGCLQPNYYASGVTIMAHKRYGIKKWEDLKDKPVCGLQGTYFNKPLAEKYGYRQINFQGIPEVELALRDGRCVAWVTDDANVIIRLPDKAKWGEYEMPPVDTLMETPWAMAVTLEEKEGPYGKQISNIIVDWHKSGWLIELEKKWGIPPSNWLAERYKEYKGK